MLYVVDVCVSRRQAGGAHTERLVEGGLAKPSDMYFVATVQRSAVTVTVHVIICPDYPISKPLMSVTVLWAGLLRTALNDEAIRVCRHARIRSLIHSFTLDNSGNENFWHKSSTNRTNEC